MTLDITGMHRSHTGQFQAHTPAEELQSTTIPRGAPLAADVHVKLFKVGKTFLVMEFFGEKFEPSSLGPEVRSSLPMAKHCYTMLVRRTERQHAIIAAQTICDVLLNSLPPELLVKDLDAVREHTAKCKEGLRLEDFVGAQMFAQAAEEAFRGGLDRNKWRNQFEGLVKATANLAKLYG